MRQRHAVLWKPRSRLPVCAAALLLSGLIAVSQTQVPSAITPDGTVGTAITQQGQVYTITGGTRPGNGPNLFHSFDRFSIGTGDTARFTGPTGLENILSRVTGGQPSVIDGLLRSEIRGAHFYLLNPHGVLFGPNAHLDVSGSLHVSTADVLHLADGATFAADLGRQSTLTVAPPSAFGFLGESPAPIALQRSVLQVAEGETLSLIGGDIQLTDGVLRAPGGRVDIASVASRGEVMPPGIGRESDLELTSFVRLGTVHMSQSPAARQAGAGNQNHMANIDVSGEGGGTVLIRGGQLLIDRAMVAAETLGGQPGGRIDIKVTDEVAISNGGLIQTGTRGRGRAGDIAVQGQRLRLTEGSQLDSSTRAAGGGGDIRITATDTIGVSGHDNQDTRSGVVSRSLGSGQAGTIRLSTNTLTMDDGVIQTQADKGGDAGDVIINVGTMSLSGGGQINSSTLGAGNGGSVTIRAAETITLAGRRTTGGGGGGGGSSDATQGRLASGIFSDTTGSGQAGNISVSAATLELNDGRISAFTFAGGHGGNIDLQVQNLNLLAGSQVGSRTDNLGQGGNVTITARNIMLDAGSQISAVSQSEKLSDLIRTSPDIGRAGTITVTALDTLRLQQGSFFTVETTQANGGNITLHVGALLYLRNSSDITTSVAGGQGDGGDILITPRVAVLQDSQIRAQAFAGRGGNIRIAAEVFLADPTSGVNASSQRGINGEVDIRAPIADISGALTPLPQNFRSAATLLNDRCAARLREGQVSTFIVSGRAGVPAIPDGILPSRLYETPLAYATPPDATSRPSLTAAAQPGPLSEPATGPVEITNWPVPVASPLLQVFECVRR